MSVAENVTVMPSYEAKEVTDSTVIMDESEIDAAIDIATYEAEAEGYERGVEAAHARISAILADETIKGKELVAVSLALKSPGMAAQDVAAFVAALPTEQKIPTISERGHGAALAMGGVPLAAPDASQGWDKIVAKYAPKK